MSVSLKSTAPFRYVAGLAGVATACQWLRLLKRQYFMLSCAIRSASASIALRPAGVWAYKLFSTFSLHGLHLEASARWHMQDQ